MTLTVCTIDYNSHDGFCATNDWEINHSDDWLMPGYPWHKSHGPSASTMFVMSPFPWYDCAGEAAPDQQRFFLGPFPWQDME